MGGFVTMLFFTNKPVKMVWMLFKMLRPHLRENRI
jgi:hypothetical protein